MNGEAINGSVSVLPSLSSDFIDPFLVPVECDELGEELMETDVAGELGNIGARPELGVEGF